MVHSLDPEDSDTTWEFDEIQDESSDSDYDSAGSRSIDSADGHYCKVVVCPRSKLVNWVGCQNCPDWFHSECVGITKRAPLINRTMERNIRRWLRALPPSVKNKMIDDAAALVFLPPDAATPGGSRGEQAAMEPTYPVKKEEEEEEQQHQHQDEIDSMDYLPGVKKEEEEEEQQHKHQHGIDSMDYLPGGNLLFYF
ncbi:hypothetical protein HCN44_003421 [Aphidius gifuensis]|uniref:PHD-type domain-containing protein n=1 Tax=Aphidius gifuensis TaxID=684658 RepID=A0A835CMX9_APHGI|nr:hypothetical protein HCN44_003421 [Aphidius gifuensis]